MLTQCQRQVFLPVSTSTSRPCTFATSGSTAAAGAFRGSTLSTRLCPALEVFIGLTPHMTFFFLFVVILRLSRLAAIVQSTHMVVSPLSTIAWTKIAANLLPADIQPRNRTRKSHLPLYRVMIFCHFHSCSGPQRFEQATRVLSHTGLTATAEISIVSVFSFHSTVTHLGGGNCYADKLLFLNCLRIAVIVTLDTLTDDKEGTSCAWSREVSLKTNRKRESFASL